MIEILDKWRKEQDDLPSRSEAIRRLIQKGLEAEPEGIKKAASE